MPVLRAEVMPVRSEHDVVLVRQATRAWATAQGLGLVDQTKIVTAASELARNTWVHGKGGEMTMTQLERDGRLASPRPVDDAPEPSELEGDGEAPVQAEGAEAGKSRKQRRTVKHLHADLVALGFTGSYGRVAAFARKLRITFPKRRTGGMRRMASKSRKHWR